MKNEELSMKERQELVLQLVKEVDRICRKYCLKYSLGYGSVLGAVRHHGFIPWDSDMDIYIPIVEEEKFREAFRIELPENMHLYEWDKEEKYHPCFDRVAFKTIPHELVHVDVYRMCGAPDNLKERKRFIKECYYSYHILSCKEKNIQFSRKRNKWKISLLKLFLLAVPEKSIKKQYRNLQMRYDYYECKNVFTITSIYQMNDYMVKEDLFDTIRMEFEGCDLPIPRKYDEYLTSIYGDYMTPRQYD